MYGKGFKRVNMIVRGPFVFNAQPNHPEKNPRKNSKIQ